MSDFRDLENLVKAGDDVGALRLWRDLMREIGARYKQGLKQGNWRQCGEAAVQAQMMTGALLLAHEGTGDEVFLIRDMTTIYFSLWSENKSHPLLKLGVEDNHPIDGLGKKSSTQKEDMAACVLACWLFLDGRSHPSPVKFLTEALKRHGYHVSESTIRSWRARHKQGKRPLIGSRPSKGAAIMERKGGIESTEDAERWVDEILSEQAAIAPLLSTP